MLSNELQNKIKEIVQRFRETGSVHTIVNFLTGNTVINGVELTLKDAQEIANYKSSLDQEFVQILNAVAKSELADKVRRNVKMTDKAFNVDLGNLVAELYREGSPDVMSFLEKLIPSLEIPFPNPFKGEGNITLDHMMKQKADLINKQTESANKINKSIEQAKSFVERLDDEDLLKDQIIENLKKQIENLQIELEKVREGQKIRLKFPDDFKIASIPDYIDIEPATDEEIQRVISELEDIEIPKYQFVAHRLKGTIVIKMHDDEGITYIVANNYFYVNQ